MILEPIILTALVPILILGALALKKRALDKNKETLLIVLLSPRNCIPTAMAIQAHQPDRVLIISAHFPHGAQGSESEDKSRLRAWMEGADELVSTFESLLEPFPIPHTKPQGYLRGPESGIEVEWKECRVDDISDVVSERCSDYEGEVRFDILPGAKDPVLGIILGHESADYSLWYTMETGEAVQLKPPEPGQDSVKGPCLSIIDRAWLGGYPVHATLVREHPLSDEEASLFRDITRNLALEPPDPDKPGKMFDLPFSLRTDDFITNIQGMGYEASRETIDEEGFVIIERGKQTSRFLCDAPPDAVAKPGNWLEELVETELWNSWKPSETVLGLSVIQPTSEARTRSFSRLWSRDRDSFEKGEQSGVTTLKGRIFAEACERHSLDTDCDIEDLVMAEIDRLKSSGNLEERIAYVRVCEIDTALLDAHGVSTFDAKVVFNPDTKRISYSQALQMPKWLLPSQYFVVSSIHPPMSHTHTHKVIHIQRLPDGRSVLDDDDSEFPRDLPDFVNFVRERTWDEPDGCKFEVPGSFDFEYIPPGKLVNLESGDRFDLGTILFSREIDGGLAGKHPSFKVFRSMWSSGYIPNEVEGFSLGKRSQGLFVVDEDGGRRPMYLRAWKGARRSGVWSSGTFGGKIISSTVEIELENGEIQKRKLGIKVLRSLLDDPVQQKLSPQIWPLQSKPSNVWLLDEGEKPDLVRVDKLSIHSPESDSQSEVIKEQVQSTSEATAKQWFPCPSPGCPVICNSPRQLEQHFQSKHNSG